LIEERAKVVAIDKAAIWVEARRESSCSRCAANKGCGNAVLQKVFGRKRNIFPIVVNRELENVSVEVGDEVVIGVKESAVVKSSFAVYVIPILAIIIFAAIGETFATDRLSTNLEAMSSGFVSKDLMSIVGAVTGLIFSIVGLRWYSALSCNKSDYQPVLLRHADELSNETVQMPEINLLG
jgi:sigma-E factor negative regulatory protein RseC